MTEDPYVYPRSRVLRNELGIRDGEQLQRFESDLTYWRAARFAARPVTGRYDLAHLQACHRALFEGLYSWAGELRSVALAKHDLFCAPEHIQSYASDVFGRLRGERHLIGLGREAFVDRLAGYYGDVNALHPFREGNGRTQRVFFGALAHAAGYEMHWQHVEPERNIEASIASMRGDERPLRELLHDVTEPLTAQRTTTARALQAAYAERDRLQDEHAAIADPPDSRRGATRRFAYEQAIARTTATIGELESANGGPLTPQQTVALQRDDQARSQGKGRDQQRGVDREREGPDLELGRD